MGTPEFIVSQSAGGLRTPDLVAGFGSGSSLVEDGALHP